MTRDEAPWALLTGNDPGITERLAPLLEQQGLTVRTAPAGLDVVAEPTPATVVVCPVEQPADLAQIKQFRAQWPQVVLVGYLRMPDQELWRRAQRGGCDLVTTRGALVRSLRSLLEQRAKGGGRRFPLLDLADAAGRLGFVLRVEETPSGPVAVFRVQGQWCAIVDRCPHAGAALSGGELDGTVVTCPRHGSQFDVRSGERLRGPADDEITTLRVVEDAGQLWLQDLGASAG